jgi:hypothetical protein
MDIQLQIKMNEKIISQRSGQSLLIKKIIQDSINL